MKNYIKANNIEVRVLEKGSILVKGVLPTNTPSGELYSKERKAFFREIIKDGCFDSVLSKQQVPQIKILLNHKSDSEQKVVKFQGKENKKGLVFQAEIEPSDELIRNIDKVRGLSFGFVKKLDSWSMGKDGWIRTILEFEDLYEISILYNCVPAYPSAVVIAEDEEGLKKEEIKGMRKAINKMRDTEARREISRMKAELNRLKGRY